MKNQKLTRLLAVVLSGLTLAFAAAMALVQPAELAPRVGGKSGGPVLLYTGPNVLYRSKHIPGSIFAGPGSGPAGIALLKQAAEKLPRDREIVIYCGCCPWDRCPNLQPPMEVLKGMGFTKVKALYLETGFKVDWIDKGYPAEAGS